MERRRSHRHNLSILVRLRIPSASLPTTVATSINLSERGVLLETSVHLEVGAQIELELKLLEEATGQPTTEWRCKGHVVHGRPALAGPGFRVGVSFDSLGAYP